MGFAGDPLTINGLVTGTGALRKAGNGTLTLSAANNYSGGTTLNAGTLALGVSGALGTGAVTVTGNSTLGDVGLVQVNLANNIAINPGVTLTTQVGITDPGGLTLSGVISGNGSLNVTRFPGGSIGILGLNGANTYTGGTTFNDTLVSITQASGLGTGAVTVNSPSPQMPAASLTLRRPAPAAMRASSPMPAASSTCRS